MRIALLALALALSASGNAAAATTYVNPDGNGNGAERCLEGYQCSGGTYDGALSLISIFEQDLGFAPGSFTRVDDDLDKVWANFVDGGGQVQALARYAGDKSKLGYDAFGVYQPLTGSLTSGKVLVNDASDFAGDARAGDFVTAPDSWVTIPLAAGTPFAFVLHDITMGYKITSNPGPGAGSSGYANSGLLALDYMVSYRVPGATPHYFIAWEDRNPQLGHMGDRDYNDFVAEVVFTVPEPQTYALLLAGLFLLLGTARRRQRAVSA
ncbi:MAG: PEP-CTERM sorting domain-containing protein [Burkholderiales bacterium]